MVYRSVVYAVEYRSWEAIWSIAILLVGVAMSFYRTDSTPPGQSDLTLDCGERVVRPDLTCAIRARNNARQKTQRATE